MPTYEWYCPECHNTTDVFHQSSDDYLIPPRECTCGNSCFSHQVISRPKQVKGFILLGDHGWHHTDFTKYRSIR